MLAVATLLTVIVTIYVDQSAAAKDRLRFLNAVEQAQSGIGNRLETYVAMLRATSALFAADGEVSRARFHDFVSQLELSERYPGLQGIGYTTRVAPSALDSLQLAIRASGLPEFSIRPRTPRSDYFSIVYIEPLNRRNRAALGYDMFSDSTRRHAMELARDSGAPVASGKVQLVQEIERRKQAGFLIYVPVYRGGSVPEKVAERRRQLLGFVYSPFRCGDLLRGVFAAESRPRLHFAIYDGERIDPAALLFRTTEHVDTAADHLGSTARLVVAGRPWTIVYMPSSGFDIASGRGFAPYVFVAGLMVSFLLFYVTRAEVLARAETERRASALRASRAALEISELRFRTMIEQSPIAIQLFSLEGACVHANDAWEVLWGAERSALVGYNILTDPQLEGLRPEIHRAFSGENVMVPPFLYDPRESGKPGRRRWIRLYFYPLRDSNGRPTEIALKIEDVTERIEAERELKLAKESAEAASRAKDRFLAVLSHELRTPLTPVLSAMQMLREELDPESREVIVDIIRRNVELEARLIDDLLDLTRIANGKLQIEPEPVDLHELIRDTVEMSRDAIDRKRIRISLELQAAGHMVLGDPARLRQVLWNLISNAAKFTPEQGSIIVRTEDAGRRARIRVTDTGIGIEPGVLPRIFNAFEQGEQTITRRFGGLGLGLAISKMLVDLHHGTISVASDGPGTGATFTVELMKLVGAPEAPRAEPEAIAAGASGSGLRILLVDDHQDTSRVMSMLLEQKGYSVITAGSIGEALQVAASQQFDLLISDIGLPDGSGTELMRRLSSERPVKGIAMSGFGMEDDIRRSLDAGFQRHLIKPVDFRQLHAAVTQLTS